MLSFLSGDTYDAIDLILFSGVEKNVQWKSALKFVKYTDKARYGLEQHFWIRKTGFVSFNPTQDGFF